MDCWFWGRFLLVLPLAQQPLYGDAMDEHVFSQAASDAPLSAELAVEMPNPKPEPDQRKDGDGESEFGHVDHRFESWLKKDFKSSFRARSKARRCF